MLTPQYRKFFSSLAFTLSLVSSVAFADTQSQVGGVVWVKGLVQASQQGAAVRTLQRSSAIYENDAIQTAKASSGQITFSDGTLLSLSPDTKISIAEYKHGGSTPPSQDAFVVNVIKGGFRTVTGVISKNHPDGYEVNTPTGTIGVQGTIYDVDFNTATKKMTVAIDKGKITIKPLQGPVITLTQGTQNIAAIVSSNEARVLNVRPAVVTNMPRIIPGPVPTSTATPVALPSAGTAGKTQIKVAPCP